MSEKRSGQTRSADETGATPRLPHERDESSESQTQGVRPIIKKAHDDVVSGKVDTDRNVPMQQAYERQKDGSTAGKPALHKTNNSKGGST